MAAIVVEPDGVGSAPCPGCGAVSPVAHGCVYANGEPHAIYFVDRCDARCDDRRAFVTLALGDWGGGSRAAERSSVCFELALGAVALCEHPARERSSFFGRFRGPGALDGDSERQLRALVGQILREDRNAAAVAP